MSDKIEVQLKFPIFEMLIAVAGAGKSTFARTAKKHIEVMTGTECVICSSDAIRGELWGDESDQRDRDQKDRQDRVSKVFIEVPVVLYESSYRGAYEERRDYDQSSTDNIEYEAFRDQEHQKSYKYRHQAFCKFG